MSCYGCKCNLCAKNVELDPRHFTPGEVEDVCWNCEECRVYDPAKSSKFRPDCPDYLEPKKLAEMRLMMSERIAIEARKKFKVIKGEKP